MNATGRACATTLARPLSPTTCRSARTCFSAKAGEPPDQWWGPGAQALGFTPGQIVERRPYDAVYRQIDPRTGDQLGRARGLYAMFANHLASCKAAEPQAITERLIELEREAA